MSARLVCDGVTKSYGSRFTLGPVSLEITRGVTCLVGANGAGKSTFFRLAARVDRPTSGSIRVDVSNGGARLGYLPQEPQLPSGATCEEFLHYVAWLQRVPRANRVAAVDSALSQVGLFDERTTRIRTLSGGMRRRVGIAHAIVHDPALLLLDEPTAGLDPAQRISARQTIGEIGHGRVVVVATHLVEDVRGLADRVIVMSSGSIVYDGDVPGLEALTQPDLPGDTDLERAIASLMGASP
jgi:ABC-2 type transport system ATP-binding protein